MSSAAHHRLEHIDGLRGLAALAVLHQHLLLYLGAGAPTNSLVAAHANWTLGHFDLGKFGVVAFFAISGYIVPFSFGSDAPRLGFVVSRFFRLYPAYWVSIAVAACVYPLLGAAPFPARQLFANLTMVHRSFGEPDVLGVYWTLAIELLFYALCLALFCAGSLRSPRVLGTLFCLLLAGALFAAVRRNGGHGGLPVALPLYLAVMLFGCCMRLGTLEGSDSARRWTMPMLVALLIVVPLAWATAYDDGSHRESVLAACSGFAGALLVFVFCVRRRCFTARPLIAAGTLSYSIYLFHPIALDCAEALAHPLAWPAGAAVRIVATLGFTLAVAVLVQRCVERPAVRQGKQVAAAVAGLLHGRRGGTARPTANGRRTGEPA